MTAARALFSVHHPGIFASLQDSGRRGQMHRGLTEGGAMDQLALRWANRLLDNTADAIAIEITLGGLKLDVLAPSHVALTGADCQARRNGAPLANWETHRLEAGDRLEFGHARQGMRGYLAVAGGLAGKAPTVQREGLGGPRDDGQPLRRGDRLYPARISHTAPTAAANTRAVAGRTSCGSARHGKTAAGPPCRRLLPPPLRPLDDPAQPLGFLPGGQWATLPERSRRALVETRWTIHADSNRMATRLEGPALTSLPGIRSEPLAAGSIQIPPDGRPLILTRDRQTLGGYAIAGWLTPLALSRLAQRRPGETLTLALTDPRRARQEWLDRLEQLGTPPDH